MPGTLTPGPGPVDTDLRHFPHLLASHPSRRDEGGQPWGAGPPGAVYGQARSSVGLFCEGRYEPPPAVGVTQRCTCRVESSAAGAGTKVPSDGARRGARGAGPGGARATASVRLTAPSLPRTWLTCF